MSFFRRKKPGLVAPSPWGDQSSDTGVSKMEPKKTFKVPTGKSRLVDLIEDHEEKPSDIKFNYVVLRPSTGMSRSTLQENLAARIGNVARMILPMRIPDSVDLRGDYHEFSFGACLEMYARDHSPMNTYPWINITHLFITFDGASSFFASNTPIKVSVRDERYLNNEILGEGVANSNGRSCFYLSMNHSVHRKDINKIKLVVENPSSDFSEDTYWGSIKLEVEVTISNVAAGYSISPFEGLIAIDETRIAAMKRDPRYKDLTWNEHARKSLRRLNKKGQLVNISDPEAPIPKGTFAGSVAGSNDSQEKISVAGSQEGGSKDLSLWRKGLPGSIPVGEDSESSGTSVVEPEDIAEETEPLIAASEILKEEGSSKTPLRSAMKSSDAPKRSKLPSSITFKT